MSSSAGSVSGLLLTTQAVVVNEPEPESAMAGMGGGGMGGMGGGMDF